MRYEGCRIFHLTLFTESPYQCLNYGWKNGDMPECLQNNNVIAGWSQTVAARACRPLSITQKTLLTRVKCQGRTGPQSLSYQLGARLMSFTGRSP